MFFFTPIAVKIIELIIELLPDVEIPKLTVHTVITDFINAAWYFLPMDTISYIFGLTIGITIFRIILAIILRIKSFVPGWGGT